MAIFAHSDDESAILPILSKYSREGGNIYFRPFFASNEVQSDIFVMNHLK